MVKQTQAIFDGTVLHPDDPLGIKPNTRVRLTIETLDSNAAPAPRPEGLCAGEFSVPEDFNAPLPEDVLREFEGQ